MRPLLVLAATGVFCLLSGLALAQSQHTAGVQECLKETDPSRLKECVSDLASLVSILRTRLALNAEQVASCSQRETVQSIRACLDPNASGKKVWEMSRDTSKMDGSPEILLLLESEDEIDLGKEQSRLALALRCQEGETNVFVFLAASQWILDDNVEVQWRLDSDAPETTTWKSSTDRNALGIWTSRPAIAFSKRLMAKTKLVFRVTPKNSARHEVVFNITGLDEVIGPLRSSCKW
jgi:type VI secretion system VasI family protein